MAVEAVLKELGVQAKVDHSDMLSAASKTADILIAGVNFKPHFDKFNSFPNKIYLNSLISKQENQNKITANPGGKRLDIKCLKCGISIQN